MGVNDIRYVAVAEPVAMAATAAEQVLAKAAARRVRSIGKLVWLVNREAIAEKYSGR